VTNGNFTPRQLFRAYDNGQITREEFRDAMRGHAVQLIEEMEEVHQNPIAAWMEMLKNRRIAWRLARMNGEVLVREIFVALSELPDFPLANWLWNADRPLIPLYCFLRTRRDPLFRVLKIETAPFVIVAHIEYGNATSAKPQRERFSFDRDKFGRLQVSQREPLG
jgi:hypothetical protein